VNRRLTLAARFLPLVVAVLVLSAPGAQAAKPPAPTDRSPEPVHIAGAIVDCADYIVLGPTPTDRRELHAASIDSGMPACFKADADGQVYLLIAMKGFAKEKFEPTSNFVGGGTTISGTLYERGSLKALTVESIERTIPKKVVDGKAVTNPAAIEKKKPATGAEPTPKR
jgi:hypothetical protein